MSEASESAPRLRVVGPGRAGRSFMDALSCSGWDVVGTITRGADLIDAAIGVDLVLICTPDAVIGQVAEAMQPGDAVVAHVAGSLGLDVLAPHPRRAAVHPLMSLPDPAIGAERLRDRGWFAVAGDPIAEQLVAALGGRSFELADGDRAVYHAAACVAANHVVALLGQVERLAEDIGVPPEAYVDLARGALDNVAMLGAAAALTGPAARGDEATIIRHLENLPASERASYEAMVREARRLAGET